MSKTGEPEPIFERDSEGNLECAICLQTCIHPAKLPCGHVFCYLCIKGVAIQSKRCAMCRQAIPADYLDKPELINVTAEEVLEVNESNYQWFYEGRNGWWRYDPRSNTELENAWQSSTQTIELLLAGSLYTIDFNGMMQHRSRHPGRKRKIKRDLVNVPAKGVAGLKCLPVDGQGPSASTIIDLDSEDSNQGTETPVEDLIYEIESLSINNADTNSNEE